MWDEREGYGGRKQGLNISLGPKHLKTIVVDFRKVNFVICERESIRVYVQSFGISPFEVKVV